MAQEYYRKVYRDRVTAGIVPVSVPKPRKGAREKRKSFGFSGKQRARMSRACEYLSSEYGLKNLRFITLTYSNERDHHQAKRDLSNLFKAINRKYNKPSYAWCAEIQPKRLITSGEAVIHFHIVISGLNSTTSAKFLWDNWSRITGASNRVDIERIKSSVGGYMAKYMAKNGQNNELRFIAESLEGSMNEKQLRQVFGQLKLSAKDLLDSYGRLGVLKIAQAMAVQGNRMGISHDVSGALKPIIEDGTHYSVAVPESKHNKMKYAKWNEENFSFLGVWGFE